MGEYRSGWGTFSTYIELRIYSIACTLPMGPSSTSVCTSYLHYCINSLIPFVPVSPSSSPTFSSMSLPPQIADAMELMILSVLSPAVKCQWNLSGVEEAIITTVTLLLTS